MQLDWAMYTSFIQKRASHNYQPKEYVYVKIFSLVCSVFIIQ